MALETKLPFSEPFKALSMEDMAFEISGLEGESYEYRCGSTGPVLLSVWNQLSSNINLIPVYLPGS